MLHFASIIHFLSLASGWAAVITALLMFAKYKKTLLLYYFFFTFALTGMTLGITVDHYAKITGLHLETANIWIGALSGNLFIFILPPLVHRIFELPRPKTFWLLCGILDFLILTCTILYLIAFRNSVLLTILQSVMFLILMYGVAIGFLKTKSLGSKEIRGFLRIVAITTLFFLPFLIADATLGQLPFLPFNLTFPTFLLILFFEIILFSFLYLDQPAFVHNNKLTPYCVQKIKLTEREKDIVEGLLEGLTNKEIAEKLFISFKTVENHLYSIYQKAEVKNRLQLINLIHANSTL
jgi:DNA-binding CsgD family transcriptional regulator